MNSLLESPQRAFQFGKEIGFKYLKLQERALTASIVKVKSFEQTLSHFSASYFSAALLVSRDHFVEDMKNMFAQNAWDGNYLKEIAQKYFRTLSFVLLQLKRMLVEKQLLSIRYNLDLL